MGRFFNSLDSQGWHEVRQGLVLICVTGLVSILVSSCVHIVVAAIFCLVGFDLAFRLFDSAMIGSIYRNRDGKNKDLYLSRKAYLDIRFEAMYENVGCNSSEKSDVPKTPFSEVLASSQGIIDATRRGATNSRKPNTPEGHIERVYSSPDVENSEEKEVSP